MNKPLSPAAGSTLRQRFIEDMTVRGFTEKTRHYYIRIVAGFAAFLGRSPDTATAEDIRRFQVHQSELGMHAPAMNSTVAALRFFFTQTLDRPDLSRKLIRLRHPRKLPSVLSAEEVARLLAAAKCLKHRAALAVAYGAGLRVTFRYKDYRRDGAERYRTMTLTADEFIRRFLLHVLPKGFHRIRHYGLLASASRKANVARVRQLLAVPPAVEPAEPAEPTDPRPPCPCCGGRMIIIETFQRWTQPRAPPVCPAPTGTVTP